MASMSPRHASVLTTPHTSSLNLRRAGEDYASCSSTGPSCSRDAGPHFLALRVLPHRISKQSAGKISQPPRSQFVLAHHNRTTSTAAISRSTSLLSRPYSNLNCLALMPLSCLRGGTADIIHEVQQHRIAKRTRSQMYLDVTFETR